MHIVLAILGILGGGLFWWYRLKVLGDAASDAIDSAGRVRGYFRRRKIRLQAEHSPLTAIEDPVLAAATVIFAIIAEDILITEGHFDAVRSVLIDISNPRKADEAMIYAKWAFIQIGDTPTVIEKTSPFLRQRLNDLEKNELIDMVGVAAAAVPVSHHYGQRVRKLKQRLGLQVD
ncbi:hypothetical protein [Phyllobacterium zundukense]|uniref:Co-chaperone DjlA N-terminal domain-containing protein n=1 Tax=Phyllobacterium zundukense TaxID=1867719 RepID=A0A2N9VXB4_9HYPH|nr:hypothetical protein [Phyllobacterium zundukense]ATU93990.1 hypothetical protein BLM14_19340 [Phyllobacterium zundukense]PIO44132.1 hypothetical protein B5P45_15335 [Phyllobacterium zundukense]